MFIITNYDIGIIVTDIVTDILSLRTVDSAIWSLYLHELFRLILVHGHTGVCCIIIIIIRHASLLSQAFLPGTSLEPAVIPTAQS